MNRWVASSWKLPVLSGLLIGLGYYVPVPLLNLLGFVPLLYWIDRNPAAGRPAILRAGFLFGGVTHLISLYFLYALLVFTWLPALLYVAFASALALRISLCVLMMSWLRRRSALSWGLLLPACWIPLEWLQSFGDLRMTGDHLAHTLAGYPFLIQFADLLGPYGVGAFMLLTNGLAYESLIEWRSSSGRRAALALALLWVAVLGYDAHAWLRPDPAGQSLRIAIVQPNISLFVKRDADSELEQRRELERLSRLAAEQEPDLIVWPETARPGPLYHWLELPQSYLLGDVQLLARELGSSFLVGAEYLRIRSREDYEMYNAALAVDAYGTLSEDWTAKRYLVPFVEALPFRALFGPLLEGRGGEWSWITGAFHPAPADGILEVAGVRIGTLVCFEQLFSDLSRSLRNAGAEIQVVITNDAWFGRTAFQRYQADVLRLRAIENRSEFVRVANTGISGFVDSRGRYRQETALFEPAVVVADVFRSDARTFYDRHGDAIVGLALIVLLSSLLLARRSGPIGPPW